MIHRCPTCTSDPTAIPRGNRKLQIQKDTCRTQQPPVDTFTGIQQAGKEMDALLKALPKNEPDSNSNKSSLLSVAFSPKKPDGAQSPATLLSPKLKLGGLGGGKWALLKKSSGKEKAHLGT